MCWFEEGGEVCGELVGGLFGVWVKEAVMCWLRLRFEREEKVN